MSRAGSAGSGEALALRRPSVAVRVLDEILLYSGQYALFYILMYLTDPAGGFLADLGHTTLALTLVVQTAVLVAWGDRPLVRFLGSLITPALYAIVESPGLTAFFLDTGHMGFWLFSVLIGGLQSLALLTPRERLKVTLEFLSTFLSVAIFIAVYFSFDERVVHEQLVAAGKLPASKLAEALQITALGDNLKEFFSDGTHVYVAIGGAVLAFALARGRAKVLRLTQRVSALFGTYVDGRVRDRIIGAEGALADTREVAVLFSDIRNFTPLTERSEASSVVKMLNAFFSEWDRVSQAHGGIIDKFIGDAVMIIFEPREGSEPSRDAVRCAQAMLGGLPALRDGLAADRLPVISRIGVGIDFGPVILGNIGSARRRNYTAIGDTVNTASRLENACKEHSRGLIVSAAVYERLDDELRAGFSCLGTTTLKGKAAGVNIFGAFPA
jgi:class 3 adenylate cyclase